METTETVEAPETDTHLDECVMPIREYKGQRVITLADIDRVHKRPEGTARKRFNDSRKHFIEGEDMFTISPDEFRRAFGEHSMDLRQQNNVILLTESGYLMVVKSLTDDLAWRVQTGSGSSDK